MPKAIGDTLTVQEWSNLFDASPDGRIPDFVIEDQFIRLRILPGNDLCYLFHNICTGSEHIEINHPGDAVRAVSEITQGYLNASSVGVLVTHMTDKERQERKETLLAAIQDEMPQPKTASWTEILEHFLHGKAQ